MLISLFLIACMLAVIWFDLSRYMIPNWLSGLVVVAYPVAVVMSPVPVNWQHALLGFVIAFSIGYIMFAKKWMGGGDIKLIIACSLWTGLEHLVDFIVMFAILGGVFSIVLYALRKAIPFMKINKTMPRPLRQGEPVPYGVTIAIAFIFMMKMGYIPVVAGAGFGL